jgi:hypothetical protein
MILKPLAQIGTRHETTDEIPSMRAFLLAAVALKSRVDTST